MSSGTSVSDSFQEFEERIKEQQIKAKQAEEDNKAMQCSMRNLMNQHIETLRKENVKSKAAKADTERDLHTLQRQNAELQRQSDVQAQDAEKALYSKANELKCKSKEIDRVMLQKEKYESEAANANTERGELQALVQALQQQAEITEGQIKDMTALQELHAQRHKENHEKASSAERTSAEKLEAQKKQNEMLHLRMQEMESKMEQNEQDNQVLLASHDHENVVREMEQNHKLAIAVRAQETVAKMMVAKDDELEAMGQVIGQMKQDRDKCEREVLDAKELHTERVDLLLQQHANDIKEQQRAHEQETDGWHMQMRNAEQVIAAMTKERERA